MDFIKKYKNELNGTENLKIQLQSGYIKQFKNKEITNKIEKLKDVFRKQCGNEGIKKKIPDYPNFSSHIFL